MRVICKVAAAFEQHRPTSREPDPPIAPVMQQGVSGIFGGELRHIVLYRADYRMYNLSTSTDFLLDFHPDMADKMYWNTISGSPFYMLPNRAGIGDAA